MRLRPENTTTEEQLAEFDQWLTAKLVRIKDSDKFNSEINALCSCIQIISQYLDNFSDHGLCNVDNLCEVVIKASDPLLQGSDFVDDEKRVTDFYKSIFNLLFLTSGATDNNLKNHFLIKLNDDDVKSLVPKRNSSKKRIKFKLEPLPTVVKSNLIAKILASCFVGSCRQYRENVITEPVVDLRGYLRLFLKEYVSSILEEQEDVMQFWATCHSFVSLNQLSPGKALGRYLLNSHTIFKVRGSVSASGGHITEETLRQKLLSMGLRPEFDFNTSDVTIGVQKVVEGDRSKKKTRAYDFVLPYKVDNWEPKPKLFIQSQFYAGDSGSVSHKVVDQTQSSRAFTLEKYANARFVEYLDGAGYYASLRVDLAHMLSFKDTASFFQVKSILIRLRRELQHIDFLTPIEYEHAILTSATALRKDVHKVLLAEGYPREEINRIEAVCLESGYVQQKNKTLSISSDRLDIARRLLILDVAANNSTAISDQDRNSLKYLLVPGYGANHGILESELTRVTCSVCKQIKISATDFTEDIEWLLDEGVFKRR